MFDEVKEKDLKVFIFDCYSFLDMAILNNA